ncbi:oxidoreductase [Paenibacillus sp. VT-400]|uniref:SDR family oxidoreductase n=1 Tax=Paenibacillus sp. VT-400 TaxID=1495853 RepID=UPI00064AD356|nr:SDR family oxidoreductase [Paenibacillus sp. VT-400]KLU54981.1 oxidoreductase [Paenibacillus sp. VT-400]
MQDKVIIITGASSGIGKATAKLLAQKGAKIVAGARRKENLEELVTSIQATGGTATFQVTDVTQRGDVENLVQHAVDMYGKVDVIINNAGVMPLSTMDKLKVDEWEKMISVNINGVLYGIAAALPVMQKQGYGHIINTSSTAGHVVEPTAAVYAGTKFAVRAISEGLRKESGGKIKVTVISPGVTETELGQDITDETSAAGLKEIRKTALPAEVIADAIAYAIDQPSYVDVSEVLVRELGRI